MSFFILWCVCCFSGKMLLNLSINKILKFKYFNQAVKNIFKEYFYNAIFPKYNLDKKF